MPEGRKFMVFRVYVCVNDLVSEWIDGWGHSVIFFHYPADDSVLVFDVGFCIDICKP